MAEQGGESQAESSEYVPTTLDQDIAAALKEVNEREQDTDEVTDEVEESEEVEDTEADLSEESEGDDDPSTVIKGEDEEFEIPEPLEHWSKDDKELFESLEDDKKQWWLDKVKSLEKGYQEKFEEVAEYRKERDSFDEIFSPYDAQLKSSGMTRSDVVKRLVTAQQYLEQKPQEAIEWLARSYGVELGKPASPNESDDEYLEPETREIRELRQKVAELERSTQQDKQYQEQQAQQQYQAQIQSFASEKAEDGSPKRPHFEKVKNHMAALLGQGQAKDLQDAYDQAVRANPETWELLLEEREKEKEAKRKQEVQKAKKAGKNVKTKAPTPKSEQEEVPDNLNDLIKGEFSKFKQSA